MKNTKEKHISEVVLTIQDVDLVELFGEHNSKIKLIKKAFQSLSIISRGNIIKLKGDKKNTQNAKSKIELLVRLLKDKHELPVHVVEDVLEGNNPYVSKERTTSKKIIVNGRDGVPIRAKTPNQLRLVEVSAANDIVFALGPAGTGKTYVAVALAVRALKNRLVKRIILTRPAVEAGENLGFLPGDLKEKVDPYLRPLYDALDDMIPAEKLNYFMSNRVIEIAPLAFMRGRTLDNSFIILDEAQNATTSQLKMFLTRIGPSARCIITGDLSQIDLPRYQRSGLKMTTRILRNLEGIGKVELDESDVVRHRLVRAIIKAYEKEEEE